MKYSILYMNNKEEIQEDKDDVKEDDVKEESKSKDEE